MKNYLRSNIAYLIPIAAIVIFLIFLTSIYFMPSLEKIEKSTVYINGRSFDVEIADTAKERARGLQFHEPLDENEGMLFIFEREGYHGFWMPNMAFALDIIWINKNFEIVHIERNVPPCESIPCKSYKPSNPAMYVVEINANTSNNINLGDIVDLENALS